MDSINWDAIGAMGQWFGGIITAAAVYIAMRKDKPKIVIEVKTNPVMDGKYNLMIFATNVGHVPVSIKGYAVRYPFQEEFHLNPIDDNCKAIMPAEKVKVVQATVSKHYFDKFKKDKHAEFFFVVVDHQGHIYYDQNKFFYFLARLFIYTFMRKKTD